ncbi:MAG: thiamine pyrophosphate-binding protein, partial [Phascolarctobacterium sp.]|nr:thiamine pyrophosphate-binding protein [Phascolarctobacterium sp.]
MPITKHNFLVKDPAHLAQTLRLAFQMAKTGRPGPVLVDVPRDVQTALIDYEAGVLPPVIEDEPTENEIAACIEALKKAERPVMLIGGGVISADAEYDAMHLCEKLHIPVVSTLMGLGAISAYRKLFLGMTGLHGHERANNAVKEADLILAVGTRFNDRVTGERKTYNENKVIIHLDIDPAELDKNIFSTIGISANMNKTLQLIEAGSESHNLDAWWERIEGWPSMDEDFGDEAAPEFFKALNPVIKDKDYIITTDVGQHQMWAAQHLRIQFARQWITSGGLGTMGFGLPAAMGAQLARPKSRVISLSGDGGFKMTGSELFTIASYKLPVTAIVFNNSGLGMIRQLQTVSFAKRFTACEFPGYVDFVKYGEAFGVRGEHVTTPEQLAAAVEKAMEMDEPYIIEVTVDPKNMVLPMVMPGAGIGDYVKFKE